MMKSITSGKTFDTPGFPLRARVEAKRPSAVKVSNRMLAKHIRPTTSLNPSLNTIHYSHRSQIHPRQLRLPRDPIPPTAVTRLNSRLRREVLQHHSRPGRAMLHLLRLNLNLPGKAVLHLLNLKLSLLTSNSSNRILMGFPYRHGRPQASRSLLHIQHINRNPSHRHRSQATLVELKENSIFRLRLPGVHHIFLPLLLLLSKQVHMGMKLLLTPSTTL